MKKRILTLVLVLALFAAFSTAFAASMPATQLSPAYPFYVGGSTPPSSIPAFPLFPAKPNHNTIVTNYVPSDATVSGGIVTVPVYGGTVSYPATTPFGGTATITVTPDAEHGIQGIWVNGKYHAYNGGSLTVRVFRPLYVGAWITELQPFFEATPFPEEEKVELNPLMIATYTDVYSYDPAYTAIQYVTERRLMQGVGYGRFDPNGTFTRAMMATVLWRLEGSPSVLAYDARFSDVAANMWYTEPVLWASAAGVVEGTGKGAFDPNGALTHGELCAMLGRWDSGAYMSEADAWAWAQANNMYAAVSAAADSVATRAEIAQVLMVYFSQVR